MRIELLIDSNEFWRRFELDLGAARDRVYLQTFSFEGDKVGAALGEALECCQAHDRRFLVDSYTLLCHNDRVIAGPALLRSAFRAEVRATREWVRRLRASGVGMRFTNPLRPTLTSLLKRNHKKLAVIDDDVVYLGGINFCEHNFDWHDAMLRIEGPKLADHLSADFLASWSGRPAASDRTMGPIRVLSLNGDRNPDGFLPILEAIDGSRECIDVVSAYLSPPFSDHLARAVQRGVRVRILTPAANNKLHLAGFVREAARRHGFALARYPGRMNHMKAMVVDDRYLIIGSTNFDTVGYYLMDELYVIIADTELIGRFRQLVWHPDTEQSALAKNAPSISSTMLHHYVRGAARLIATLAPP